MKKIAIDLGVPHDDLASCVSCGLCLPHCPTYRVTQEESASPRGRIALMKHAESTGFIDEEFVDFMDACIQCRGCETACPAGVEFGSMMEATREALATQTSYQPWWRRLGYRMLGRPTVLAFASRVLSLLQRVNVVPKKLGLPQIPIIQRRLLGSGTDVWLFTGCIMDAWMRDTHRAVQRVVEATGAGVQFPNKAAACCGALHVHAGLGKEARLLAERTMTAFPGDAPILVDSAGCGAQLKEYGHLLGTELAEAFSLRVFDVHEWLAERLDQLPQIQDPSGRVAVQDPCHLRHVQKTHQAVYQVLGQYTEPVGLDDEGLCCGAGGAYSAFHQETAAQVRDRKIAAIGRSGAAEVASANPGCLLHLRSAGVEVRHPLEIIDSIMTKDG
ncbi:MAG: heterodisulfide reductase-related iron-sulfur binding cluster [Acidimicrobiales bacterium]|nr:heterodisulfide reductase-related iron-sulfur binding cluster [Acidimicrobiales bacterium]